MKHHFLSCPWELKHTLSSTEPLWCKTSQRIIWGVQRLEHTAFLLLWQERTGFNGDLPKVQFCGGLWIEEAPLCRILFSHYKDSGPHKSSSFWVQWSILDIIDLQKHAGDSAKGVCFSKKTMSNKGKSGSQVRQDTGLGTAPSSLPALFPVRVAATLEPMGHVLADSPMA